MAREDNVAVFEDTEKLCKSNPKLKESVQKSITQQRCQCTGGMFV